MFWHFFILYLVTVYVAYVVCHTYQFCIIWPRAAFWCDGSQEVNCLCSVCKTLCSMSPYVLLMGCVNWHAVLLNSCFMLLLGYSHHLWRWITDCLPAKWNWQRRCYYTHVCRQLRIRQGQNPWRRSGLCFVLFLNSLTLYQFQDHFCCMWTLPVSDWKSHLLKVKISCSERQLSFLRITLWQSLKLIIQMLTYFNRCC